MKDSDAFFIASPPVPLPRPRSARARVIAKWFGLDQSLAEPSPRPGPLMIRPLLPKSGILLITGPSGSGKSSLLRSIVQEIPHEDVMDLAAIDLPQASVVNCFGRIRLKRVLELLSRVGLSEAWTYLRFPSELSDGQRWRLRLAVALLKLQQSRAGVLICDEFAAMLDRVTAAVISRTLSREIDASGHRAVIVTSHDDLTHALAPTRMIQCDFGQMKIQDRPPIGLRKTA